MTELTTELKSQIDHWLAKFPEDQKQSAIVPALMIVQEHNDGWLSSEWIEAVADYLGIPKIAAYEVATFYTMFDLEKVGKHKINVCTSISCMLCGSDEIIEHLEKKLAIKLGETTKDGLFTLRHVECAGACSDAPVMDIDRKYYERLTIEKVDEIIDKLTEGNKN